LEYPYYDLSDDEIDIEIELAKKRQFAEILKNAGITPGITQ
jgi:hypothetical protein